MSNIFTEDTKLIWMSEEDNCDFCNTRTVHANMQFWGYFLLCENCDRLEADRYEQYCKNNPDRIKTPLEEVF